MTSRVKTFSWLGCILLGLCLTISSPAAADKGLTCNIRTADITPQESVLLAGFANRKLPSNGIHRPLHTHCLVLKSGTEKICLISNDLMEISMEDADRVRDRISSRSGIAKDRILMHNIHTHSAPRNGGTAIQNSEANKRYAESLFRIISDNAVQAVGDEQSFTPFRIRTGKVQCRLNGNRRRAERGCDPDVMIVRLEDTKGKTLATLVNYACHPVSLNWESYVVSPDFPGIAAEQIEKQWGGTVLYLNGAAGDVDPAGKLRADTAYTESRGEMLARAVLGAELKSVRKDPSLKIYNETVPLPFRVSEITPDLIRRHAEEIRPLKNQFRTWPEDVTRWEKRMLQELEEGKVKNYRPVAIGSLRIGTIVLLFSQGEPFHSYQMEMRKRSKAKQLLFMGYTNGQNCYLPDAQAFQEGGYEVDQMYIYIGAPYPLSDKSPQLYLSALEKAVDQVR